MGLDRWGTAKHLRRVSTAYAGVLLDTDGSMKWRR
jgi:hypothetical protein